MIKRSWLLAGVLFPSAALSQATQLPFVAVQPETFDAPGSLSNAWADFDRDGDLDLAVSNKSGEIRLYRNDGGKFTNIGPQTGLPTKGYEIRSLAWGDYDGDGWPDLQAGPTTKAPDTLTLIFHNLKGRKFVNVAPEIGLTIPNRSSRHTNWVDFDNDGDLDLYATDRAGVNRLLRNDGGKFVEVDASRAPSDTRPTVGACWFDFDQDGDLDVFTANQAGAADGLWRNDGDKFTDVAADLGIANPGRAKTEGGVGCAIGDFDNDGFLDIFVPNYGHNTLYRGRPGGRFEDVSERTGVGVENHAVGAAWGDYDNDGWLDLMITSYTGSSGQQQPKDALFHNNGGTGFTDVLAQDGIVNAGDHGVTWIDFNRDGALDLSLTRGYSPIGGHPLFRNTASKTIASKSLSVLVLDAKGLSVVPGAEVRVFDANHKILATRLVEASGGYGSQNSAPVHFGLPSASAFVTVEVTFMGRRGRQVVAKSKIVPTTYAGRSLVVRRPIAR